MNTQTKINEIIQKSLAPAHELKPEHKLIDDLGADSLDLVELTMAIEDEFDLHIPDEDVDKWVTMGDVHNYIGSKL